ncbi:MAG TPA: DUF898 family protein [Bacteroidia bacterium]|jgi:uncharacterized membrane protein YjgN (DUF898 family)|nr:DUF898 family protein [Bacteroidia bacterium]HQF27327.1 DUF898 family protein [Bacteroidia bacterium]HQK97185.1 DUF898 family protein [Bacteroidia bacterium]
MEIINQPNAVGKRFYPISFKGKGSEYFGIAIVNLLLTIITLGLYYPWSKARQLQYLYGTTEFNDSRFEFHGTGAEMFKGFIKAILIITVLYGLTFLFIFMRMPIIGILVMYLGLFAIIPLAIHGSYKYRMSRTSWRGIRFGYRGDRNELFKIFIKGVLLTIVTIGIYGAWFSMNLRNYILGKIKFGNAQFTYNGDGGKFFWMNVKGYLLTIVTLGIYAFWWQKDIFNYYIDNLKLSHDDKNIEFKSTATGGDFFGLLIVNFLILIFTLGIGYPWIVARSLRFIFSKIQITGDIDFNNLIQSEENYTDATGDDMSDMLDIGFVV